MELTLLVRIAAAAEPPTEQWVLVKGMKLPIFHPTTISASDVMEKCPCPGDPTYSVIDAVSCRFINLHTVVHVSAFAFGKNFVKISARIISVEMYVSEVRPLSASS